MDALAIFNSLEAAFWITIGVVVYRRSRLSDRNQRLGRITAAWFVLFGISDIFEAYTGAWYRPWPLLVFKRACIVALVTSGIVYRNTKASRSEQRNIGQ